MTITRSPKRIHLRCWPGAHRHYEVTIGNRHRGTTSAWFRSPAEVQAVLRGLRVLDRQRASQARMADYLAAGRSWAHLRRTTPLVVGA